MNETESAHFNLILRTVSEALSSEHPMYTFEFRQHLFAMWAEGYSLDDIEYFILQECSVTVWHFLCRMDEKIDYEYRAELASEEEGFFK